MRKKRVAIVGGAGFMGHNLALYLQSQNYEVTIIDSLSVNNLLNVINVNYDDTDKNLLDNLILNQRLNLIKKNKIKFIIQDARDYHLLSRNLDSVKPHIIVHLAAVSHSSQSNKDPFNTFDHSFRTLENSLDNAKNKIEHFIYVSSSMVYGNFKTSVVTEDYHCEPMGIYGALKYSGEKLVIAYNQVFDLPYTIIRPSALYGERCISRRVGQIFLEKAFLNRPLEVVDGGSDMLDFTYVDDLLEGFKNIIENKNSLNQIFNITYGNAKKIISLVDILREYFPELKLKNMERDRLSPKRGTLSIEKAQSLLGYKPKWDIEKGYRKYYEWYKNIFEEYKKTSS